MLTVLNQTLNFTTPDSAKKNAEPLLAQLRRDGVAVVKVIPDEKLGELRSDLDALFHEIVPSQKTAKGSGDQGGLMKRYGGGVSENVMKWRLQPGIRYAFEAAHGLLIVPEGDNCNEKDSTTTSFDGVAYVGKEEKRRADPTVPLDGTPAAYARRMGSNLPPHIDLNYVQRTHGSDVSRKLREMETPFEKIGLPVQGYLCAIDTPPGGAGFVCASGKVVTEETFSPSHFLPSSEDFVKLSTEGYAEYAADDSSFRSAEPRAGEMVLWVSPLPHGNKAADKGVDPRRSGIYVCRMPDFSASLEDREETFKRKLGAMRAGKTQDHWPEKLTGFSGGSHYSNSGANKTRVLFGMSCGVQHGSPEYSDELLCKMRRAM